MEVVIRCKACDNVLKDREIYINQKTGVLEELCGVCRASSYGVESELEETEDAVEDMDQASKVLDESGEVW